jgi:N-acetylglucosamine-6-sulfatase
VTEWRAALNFAVLVGVLLVICLGLPREQARPSLAQTQAPNILVVGTDDNNYEVLREAMDNVNTRIGTPGVTFKNFTYAQSLCCPNRAATQRGQYPHNTDVLRNEPPHGGFETFKAEGYHLDTLGRTIDEAGYNTAYLGKYMNGYESFLGIVPKGWDRWISGAPRGECLSFDGNKRCPQGYGSQAHDLFMVNRAVPIVENWDETAGPDMMFLSLYNPHGPWEHPASYDDMFGGARPESPAFAETDVSDKPPFVRGKPNGVQARQEWLREYREKLRSAAYTDDLIGRVLDTLEATGESENSFVVFWNDNGYKTGHHRLTKKNSPYLEDERFPLLVRGPGIDSRTVRTELTNTVDIRPTLEDMAGASEATPDYVDGSSFLPLAQGKTISWRRYTYGESVWELSDGAAAQVRIEAKTLHKQGKHREARAMLAVMSESDLPAWRAVYTQTGAYHIWLSGTSLGYEEFYALPTDRYELDGTVDAAEETQVPLYRERMAEFQECAAETCRGAGFLVPESSEARGP